jgi:hypothetical protein
MTHYGEDFPRSETVHMPASTMADAPAYSSQG